MEKRGNTLSIELLDSYFNATKDYPLSLLTPLEMKILSLASTISEKTGIILLDEPTWGIDSNGLETLLVFLDRILKVLTEPTLLVITHDHAFLKLLDAEVLQLYRGSIQAVHGAGEGVGYLSGGSS
jgi:ATPase subunit of ABC transporter with duplicated ATPase domains